MISLAQAAELAHPEEVIPFLVTLLPLALTMFVSTAAVAAGLAWWLSYQFERNRKHFHISLSAMEAKLIIMVKEHEAADVSRFDQVWEHLINRPPRRAVDINPPAPMPGD